MVLDGVVTLIELLSCKITQYRLYSAPNHMTHRNKTLFFALVQSQNNYNAVIQRIIALFI